MTRFGLRGLVYRAVWELDGRSGFKALRTPARHVPMPASVPSFADWTAELRQGHYLLGFSTPRLPAVGSVEPPDWHDGWPRDAHWTEALGAGLGDVRLVWEVNRFGQVWDWVRDEIDHRAEFEAHLDSWRAANQFRAGVNWASGQELAIRSFAWLVGGAAYGARMSPGAWQRLVELLYWHGKQIEAEFRFAREAVRNNHLLAEALGLAVLGDAFPGFEEAQGWRRLGLSVLLRAAEEQFFEDGGYCQSSHNYHRFALELLVLASRWFPEIRSSLSPILARSRRYFEAIVEHDGSVSNYGPNDSSRAFRLDDADHLDFRPLLRLLDSAPPVEPVSASFQRAGIHILRSVQSTVTMRCGPLSRRGGHSDALHIDIRLGGKPVAIDAGSYSYHAPEHAWFVGAVSHNVCMVDHQEPRELLGRFTWERGADPSFIEFNPKRGLMAASYDAYPDIHWERCVSIGDDGVVVEDRLSPTSSAALRWFRLHWLLDCEVEQVRIERDGFTWNIEIPDGRIELVVHEFMGALSDVTVGVEPAFVSWYYGAKSPASSLVAVVRGVGVHFSTRFRSR